MELSYYPTLKKRLPSEIHHLFPKVPDAVPVFDVKSDPLAMGLAEKIRTKTEGAEVLAWLGM